MQYTVYIHTQYFIYYFYILHTHTHTQSDSWSDLVSKIANLISLQVSFIISKPIIWPTKGEVKKNIYIFLSYGRELQKPFNILELSNI